MSFLELSQSMRAEMARAPEIVRPSKFWTDLNKKHEDRIANTGIENFRRTLAKDYFTWMRVLPWDTQIRFLVREIGPLAAAKCAAQTFGKHKHIPLTESLALNFLTHLLWTYVRERHPTISDIPEPDFGNPPKIISGGRVVSQDLANSLLEFTSYQEVLRGTICELGGGYGRNAYVAAQLAEFDQYILSDIPPALAVAQEFISKTFPNSQIFGFRSFDSYDEVSKEMAQSKFVFLLPHQLNLLPASSVDLFINISSLHEMELAQVNYYLSEIRRLVARGGHFYLKAWKISNNPDDAEKIDETDYDFSGFEENYKRTPPVQTRFFETLQTRV